MCVRSTVASTTIYVVRVRKCTTQQATARINPTHIDRIKLQKYSNISNLQASFSESALVFVVLAVDLAILIRIRMLLVRLMHRPHVLRSVLSIGMLQADGGGSSAKLQKWRRFRRSTEEVVQSSMRNIT